ncbi:hypothetical protein DERP_006420 [Dermatophagoides pteronyssinus]|uniref:Uncharacterized protein n=1 Tax=Dermatophagoides pteronyssinus TaxID=6956 RepID=A0ABQ8IQ25_DERPT|nr:hypothetical protein DERP_006420 [Dermatophagoides pteronyssinus]
MMEKAGHICLTKSLEYAFQRTQTLTTECPDCGLRLIIRYDHLVNRASSWGVIIGLSALIGYHLGVNRDRILKLTRNLLKFFNFHNDNESRRQQQQQQLYDNMRKIFRKYHKPTSLSSSSSSTSSLLPTTSNDSAFDTMTIGSDYDDYQFTYNKYYDDLFNNNYNNNYNNNINDSPNIIDNNRINNRFFQSKTVDKIDQVLHQIDDIKKSIVEIDDELYHVTGSKYANFNPDFLTLSNVGWFDDDDSLSDSEPISPNKISNHMPMDSRRKKSIYRKRRKSTKDDYYSNHQMMTTFKANDQNQQQTLSNNVDNDDESLELEQRRSSRQSFISTSEQLEWDEIECEFCFPNQSPSTTTTATIIDTNDETMENSLFIDEKSIQTSNLSSSSITQPIIMMTDEQKLQNMQDLLEEAKRLGLLNNIIDAFLQKNSNESIINQSSSTTTTITTKTLRKLSSSDQDDDYDDDDIDAYQ